MNFKLSRLRGNCCGGGAYTPFGHWICPINWRTTFGVVINVSIKIIHTFLLNFTDFFKIGFEI